MRRESREPGRRLCRVAGTRASAPRWLIGLVLLREAALGFLLRNRDLLALRPVDQHIVLGTTHQPDQTEDDEPDEPDRDNERDADARRRCGLLPQCPRLWPPTCGSRPNCACAIAGSR